MEDTTSTFLVGLVTMKIQANTQFLQELGEFSRVPEQFKFRSSSERKKKK